MSELQRYMTNFASAYDRYGEHMRESDPQSIDDLKQIFPLHMEMLVAQWAASLEIKTKHDLMKTSIDGIR